MHPFYSQDSSRDGGDMFNGGAQGLQQINFQQLGGFQQVNMDVFDNLLAVQEAQTQNNQGQSQALSSSNPQALLEHQLKLAHLQQLQQLQNQIFQQQMELLSGGQHNSFSSTLPPVMDRQRDTTQFGLPTPAQSGELRAIQSSEFVSPMLLHSSGSSGLGEMVHNHSTTAIPNFLAQMPLHMIPPTPHSAPAHLAFHSPGFSATSSSELEINDLPPISSPIIGSYSRTTNNTSVGSSSQATGRLRSPTPGAKRPNMSSSGDESSSTARPLRKRHLPADKNSSSVASSGKRVSTRTTRSATNTPYLSGSAPSFFLPTSGVQDFTDVSGETSSPVDPPMPPPAHPPQEPSLSGTPESFTLPTPPIPSSPVSDPQPARIKPATPARMLKLGKLAVGNTLTSQMSVQEGNSHLKSKQGKPVTRSNTGAMGPKMKYAEKAAGTQLISPALKPIRPAGGGPVTPASASPAAPFIPPQIRKSSHKAAEQKRRDSLKTSFDDLRILLPPIPLPSEEGYPDEPILPGAMPPRGPPKGNIEGPNRGVSKLQLLRCGNEYIKVLKGRVDRRDAEIARLREEVRRLRIVIGDEAAAAPDGQEMIDLECDLDTCENSQGAFARAIAGRGSSVIEDEDD